MWRIDRYCINTLKRALNKEADVQTSSENLYSIIESDFSPQVNPVQAYFHSLPAVKQGAVTALADCVSVANPEKWRGYLTKWLVAVVANAMDDKQCCNHTCLVLTGEQGKFKTTFRDLLCPPALSDYRYTGKIYPQEKDVLSLIGQNLIINIDDQLKALNKRDENELKNLITCPQVKYRMPYEKHIVERPHLASFVASVNGNDFLTDPTGSRRFLPFEVLAIDIDRAKTIPMDAVYSEAKALLKSGFRYWFNDEEIIELHHNSEAFQVYTTEMELLLRYFTFPTEAEKSHQAFLYDQFGDSWLPLDLHPTAALSQTDGCSPAKSRLYERVSQGKRQSRICVCRPQDLPRATAIALYCYPSPLQFFFLLSFLFSLLHYYKG